MQRKGVYMNFRNRLANFMYGRYGFDQYSRFLIGVVFVICILSFFFNTYILNILNVFLIIYTYFRIFSKNIYKRAAENEKYLKMTSKIRKAFRIQKKTASQRKYYKFFKCPQCKQTIRVPKGHGRIEIKCPKCKYKFIKKS